MNEEYPIKVLKFKNKKGSRIEITYSKFKDEKDHIIFSVNRKKNVLEKGGTMNVCLLH